MLDRGLRPRVLVARDDEWWLLPSARHGHGHDLLGEHAALLRGGALLLATQREGVLIGARDIADADDEMGIEISATRLPPLPPDAPDVAARLRSLIETSGYRDTATPVTTFQRDDAAFAWSEFTFASSDTKRAEAASKPARGRWLVASNAWVQALLTGYWWETDVTTAERAWDDVVSSLRLAGRIVTPPESHGDA